MIDATGLVPKPARKMVLRVEGPDDKGVLVAVLQHLGAGRKIDVRESGGIDRLIAAIPVELKGSDLGCLGVVADADASAQSCWDRIHHALTSFGYKRLPKHLPADGLIVRPDDLPIVGVWIMPNNTDGGAIEHFAHALVPANDLLWPKAESVIRDILSIERRFVTNFELKATMHSWLAWQAEPDRPMGQAITKRFLDPTSMGAEGLYRWLRTLYEL